MAHTVTRVWIKQHTTSESSVCAINASQCKILGFEWKDLRKGWADQSEGLIISNASAELFELLKGAKGKNVQKKIIEDFKQRKRAYLFTA